MYNVKEIKTILSNCNSMNDILKVCTHLIALQKFGQSIKLLQGLALKRVLEI